MNWRKKRNQYDLVVLPHAPQGLNRRLSDQIGESKVTTGPGTNQLQALLVMSWSEPSAIADLQLFLCFGLVGCSCVHIYIGTTLLGLVPYFLFLYFWPLTDPCSITSIVPEEDSILKSLLHLHSV